MTNEQLCVRARAGDAEAKNSIVENNLGYIRQTANSMFSQRRELCLDCGIDADDLIQEGCLSLLKAADRFIPELGNKFLTYAAPAIRNAMLDLLDFYSSMYEQKIQDKKEYGLIRLSLFELVGDEETSQWVEIIADELVKSPEQICIDMESIAELRHAWRVISARDRAYLLYRFGFTDELEHPIAETAKHFHLTPNRAKKTEALALDNIWLELPWWFHE